MLNAVKLDEINSYNLNAKNFDLVGSAVHGSKTTVLLIAADGSVVSRCESAGLWKKGHAVVICTTGEDFRSFIMEWAAPNSVVFIKLSSSRVFKYRLDKPALSTGDI
nr:MAG: hypothetical protein 2 [Guangxi cystovirus 17]